MITEFDVRQYRGMVRLNSLEDIGTLVGSWEETTPLVLYKNALLDGVNDQALDLLVRSVLLRLRYELGDKNALLSKNMCSYGYYSKSGKAVYWRPCMRSSLEEVRVEEVPFSNFKRLMVYYIQDLVHIFRVYEEDKGKVSPSYVLYKISCMSVVALFLNNSYAHEYFSKQGTTAEEFKTYIMDIISEELQYYVSDSPEVKEDVQKVLRGNLLFS